jgi:hypothetical protein
VGKKESCSHVFRGAEADPWEHYGT